MIELEWLITSLAVLFVGTQMVWPAIVGKPVFPLFRRKNWADRQLREAEKRKREAELLLEAEEKRAKTDELEHKVAELQNKRIEKIFNDK